MIFKACSKSDNDYEVTEIKGCGRMVLHGNFVPFFNFVCNSLSTLQTVSCISTDSLPSIEYLYVRNHRIDYYLLRNNHFQRFLTLTMANPSAPKSAKGGRSVSDRDCRNTSTVGRFPGIENIDWCNLRRGEFESFIAEYYRRELSKVKHSKYFLKMYKRY